MHFGHHMCDTTEFKMYVFLDPLLITYHSYRCPTKVSTQIDHSTLVNVGLHNTISLCLQYKCQATQTENHNPEYHNPLMTTSGAQD